MGLQKAYLDKSSASGRAVYASEDLEPGSIVAFGYSLGGVFVLPNQSDSICNFCLEEGSATTSLRRCSACKLVTYCSTAHQRQDWKLGHKHECKVSQSQRRSGRVKPAGPTERLCGRLLLAAAEGSTLNRQDASDRISTLMTHKDDYLRTQGTDLIMMATSLAFFLGRKLTREQVQNEPMLFLRDEIEMICRIQCNGATITNSNLNPLALGLFPEICFFNHSCDPNSIISYRFDDAQGQVCATVRLIKPVKKADELCIAYADILQTVTARRENLLNGYCFLCKCDRCDSEKGLAFTDSMKATERVLEEIHRLYSRKRSSEAGQLLNRLRSDSGRDQSCPVLEAKLFKELSTLAIREGEYDKAASCFRVALENMQASRVCENSPIIGVNLALLGKTLLYLELVEESARVLRRAVDALTIAYGNDEEMVLDCQLLLEQALHEQAQKEMKALGV
mmetsp:Transcript_14063/g.20433  ORF Transcript_14063/g.20433 Transcript_14063/m.20433 type:complete len:451 (-) Transcript_14063:312-1664(-)|eukprot:CAMPEP_0184748502 /NCGR_PEP_ID=MMETSP0315-20130426/19855_1 /TAXON_ID=101924 /ORGANISM="Rhodosorus marinus, Strain UTEX LB 2760" /LENGTH=450 /DNA_ID=CAMNT_0027223833 /DNA_START=334 /DNA_END=1686 /DNA_ORIENTATION=+